MDNGTIDLINAISMKVAIRFKRKCWWADVEDMAQEARTACVAAVPNWDVAVGVPLEAYLWRVCVLSIRRFCWLESSPVTGGMHDPTKNRAGVRVTIAEDNPAEGQAYGVVLMSEAAHLDNVVDDATWSARVTARLMELADDDEDLNGLHVILGKHPASQVAESLGVAEHSVRRGANRMRSRVERDDVLFHLMGEKKEPN